MISLASKYGYNFNDAHNKFRIFVEDRDNPGVWAQLADAFTPQDWVFQDWKYVAVVHTSVADRDLNREHARNASGLRSGMVDAAGITAWKYDERGRVITETRTITNTGTFVTQWGYNSADQVDWMKYPGGNNREVGEKVSYSYDNRMALESLYSQTHSYYYLQGTSYDAAGRVMLRQMGAASLPENPLLQTSLGYYPWSAQGGRLQTLQSGWYTQTTSLQNLAYSYDAVGNVTSITSGGGRGAQTQAFYYDALDRLTSASASGGTGGLYSESYTYDPTKGNLASKGGLSYAYNDPNHVHAVTHLGGVQKYWYDANGNMSQRNVGGSTYVLTHDGESRLVEVSNAITATFKYDGDGNRVQGTLGGVTTTYIGNYYEWTSSGSTQYYYGSGSQRIAMRRSGYSQDNGLFWLFGDHLGSTAVTADGAGNKYGEVRYKAWGETRFTSGSTPTTFRYTGQRQEENLGLYFYNARWYDAYLNRWIQPDIIIPDPYNPLDWDRYSFVRNNSVKYNDPDGHCPMCAIVLFAILAVGCTSHQTQPPPSPLDTTVNITNSNGDHSSLGTKINSNTVLTHNHFGSPLNTHTVIDVSGTSFSLNDAKSNPVGGDVIIDPWGKNTGQQTRIITFNRPLSGDSAQIASQETINNIQVGDVVVIAFWDDANNNVVIIEFTISDVSNLENGAISVEDPQGSLNHGDSGGGVYFNGYLVGNMWSIVDGGHIALVPQGVDNNTHIGNPLSNRR